MHLYKNLIIKKGERSIYKTFHRHCILIYQLFFLSFSKMHSPAIIAMMVNAWTLLLVSALPMKNDLCTRLLLWKYVHRASSIRFAVKRPAELSANLVDSEIHISERMSLLKSIYLLKKQVRKIFWLLIFIIITNDMYNSFLSKIGELRFIITRFIMISQLYTYILKFYFLLFFTFIFSLLFFVDLLKKAFTYLDFVI